MSPGPSPLTLLGLVLAVGLVVAVGGWLLYRSGRRGVAVDDHPVCRRCRFDLTGKPATSPRCPECGADLAAPRAVVTGNRRRLPWRIATGLCVLLLAVAGTTALSIAVGSRVDWQAAKPVWWLLLESYSSNRATREAALDELVGRSTANGWPDLRRPAPAKLDADDEQALIARVLAIQADPSIPWKRNWADVIAYDCVRGMLPASQRDAFLTSLLSPATLQVRASVRQGDSLSTQLSLGTGRGPAYPQFGVRFDRSDEQTFVDGTRVDDAAVTGKGGYSQLSFSIAPLQISSRCDGRWLTNLSPGTHVVEHRTVAHVIPTLDYRTSDIVAVPITATATFTVHPRGDPTLIEWVDDASLQPPMERALADCSVALIVGGLGHAAEFAVDANGLPMPVSFRVTLRQGRREWPVGTLATTSTGQAGFRYALVLDGLGEGTADVVFTADTDAAAGTVDVTRAWRGEVVVRDVKITRRTQ